MYKKVKYQVKVYNNNWTVLIDTIKPKDIISNISFSANINWWQWQLNIEINKDINDTTYNLYNIVRVNEYSDNNKQGRWIYYWYISKLVRKQTTTRQTIVLTCLGIASLLPRILTGWYTDQDPAQSVRDITNQFNTKMWNNLIYYWSNVENFGTNLKINQWSNALEWLQNCQKITNFWWFINGDWEIYFKPKPTTATHKLKNKKDVEQIIIDEDWENIVNRINVFVIPLPWKTYEDATSIATYWLSETSENVSDNYAWVSGQDMYWTKFIEEHKDPKRKTSLIVNNQYDIGSINPGESIKVLNFEYDIDNLQIVQFTYTSDKINLNLEAFDSFWDLVINN